MVSLGAQVDRQTEAPSALSSSQHLNPVGGDGADVSSPCPIRLNQRPHERLEILRCRGVNSEQNDAGLFERDPALNGNLPEVLIQRQHDARFGFGEVQQDNVFPSSAISPGPTDIVAVGAKRFDNRPRKVLVSQEAHLRRNRIGLVFVGQVAGV